MNKFKNKFMKEFRNMFCTYLGYSKKDANTLGLSVVKIIELKYKIDCILKKDSKDTIIGIMEWSKNNDHFKK